MGDYLIEGAIAVAGAGAALLLFWPHLANSVRWRATVTPLASIIGSGFLILGPILVERFGGYAILAMAMLCAAGYAFGAAIRFNIARLASDQADGAWTSQSERVASWVLAFAYIVSVAYYLNLLGAFSARLFDQPPDNLAQIITSCVYAVILSAGLSKGFGLLEWLEKLSVSIKLAIVAALIAGLAVYAGQAEIGAGKAIEPLGFGALQMLFGLIVTVQGFETSRYLGNEYSPAERQTSMRLAQVISALIYLAYVGLLSIAFKNTTFVASETAIIDLMLGVSAILGPLLIIAALSSQFSAAIADTEGSGGLVEELTHGKMSAKGGYLVLVSVGLVLTWAADVFLIISYASRAFALYYGMQAGLAFARARAMGARDGKPQVLKMAGFASLALIGFACALLAEPFEGS